MRSIFSVLAIGGLILMGYGSRGSVMDGAYSDINFPPVATFKKYCARCHGYEGSAYGKGFGSIAEDSLNRITEDMMFGPAGLNPDSLSIAAMAAYNHALSKNIPFASVINTRAFFEKRDSLLSIEASPAAIVTGAVLMKGTSLNDSIWRMPYQSTNGRIFRITVSREEFTSVIRFPDQLWTK